MLYLVKSELKGALPCPLEQWMELLLKEMETETGYLKQGKILAQGDFAGRKGSCYIYDVESNEELHKLLGQLPTFSFIDWEVIPLLSREQNLKLIKQMQASMPEPKK